MTSSLVRTLQTSYSVTSQNQSDWQQEAELLRASYCTLQWRRGQLLVKSPGKLKQPYLPALENQQLLVNCLKHSPVNLVSVDPKIGETWVKFWADACEQAHKPMFLYGCSENLLFKQNSQPWGWLLRLIDWIAALVMLLLASPVMLVLIFLMQIYSPGSLFTREWHIGERGKLFRLIKFRTTPANKKTPGDNTDNFNTTSLEKWMRKYSLENLPQLFNVLQGEMTLISRNFPTLSDAVRLSFESQRQQLNAIPENINSWQIEAEFKPARL
ncbi:sugar transferase [Nostoc sp. CHAB 5844]|nr:sugar transferase [Nostoc sp. CHAB 5844]